jgi:hypothetical protein
MLEALRLLTTAFALERVWFMLSVRAEQTSVEVIARAGIGCWIFVAVVVVCPHEVSSFCSLCRLMG